MDDEKRPIQFYEGEIVGERNIAGNQVILIANKNGGGDGVQTLAWRSSIDGKDYGQYFIVNDKPKTLRKKCLCDLKEVAFHSAESSLRRLKEDVP